MKSLRLINHGHASHGSGCCFIVPLRVLREYAKDTSLDAATRAALQDSFVETSKLRVIREAHRMASLMHRQSAAAPAPGAAVHTPADQLFDCNHGQSLPGKSVGHPEDSTDVAIKTVYQTTGSLASFYQSVFGRNSVDNRGMDLVSSLHYRKNYDNAFWNGQQMVYGDGDGKLFTAFYASPDVIGHELTHGVTQYESALRYEGESGALNESISDVFGAVFNQWGNKWPTSNPAGWLIGAGILGPKAKAAGRTCLRDMLQPGASHCISPQPDSYKQFDPTADVHDNSGIPNKAFAVFAQALGGNSWDVAAKVWYAACTDRHLASGATFSDFATLTVDAATRIGNAKVAKAVRDAWDSVQVPVEVA